MQKLCKKIRWRQKKLKLQADLCLFLVVTNVQLFDGFAFLGQFIVVTNLAMDTVATRMGQLSYCENFPTLPLTPIHQVMQGDESNSKEVGKVVKLWREKVI